MLLSALCVYLRREASRNFQNEPAAGSNQPSCSAVIEPLTTPLTQPEQPSIVSYNIPNNPEL